MSPTLLAGILRVSLVIAAAGLAPAQSTDARVDALIRDVAQLRRTIADQDRRIAELEKNLRSLNAAAAPPPLEPIPSNTPPWRVASNWSLIRKGMSEALVTEVLGAPTHVQSVTDVRTLYYPSGNVTLIDDRVSASEPPPARELKGAASPPPSRIPSATPPSQLASNWALIKKGMSETQVVDILGSPARVYSATDSRVLDYPGGSITLKDDRVTAMSPPRF